MPNKVIDRVYALDCYSKALIGLVFRWRYVTELFDEQHDELDQYINDDDSKYNSVNDDADTYNSDYDESEYDYDTNPFIVGVNPDSNNTLPHQH